MKKLLCTTGLALSLLTLAGCTQSQPQPKPSASACTPQAPVVPASVKAGSTLKVTGPAATCAIRFSAADRAVTISLSTTGGDALASGETTAKADGSYAVNLRVPSTASGDATVAIDSGFKRECTGPSCPPLSTKLTIKSTAPKH